MIRILQIIQTVKATRASDGGRFKSMAVGRTCRTAVSPQIFDGGAN
jgi:hypothetical protein